MNKATACLMAALIFMATPIYGEEAMTLKPRDSKAFFQKLSAQTMDLVDEFYAEDMHFIDPVVEFQSREDMKHYYQSAYKGVDEISFDVPSVLDQGDEQVIVWVMTMTVHNMNKGRPIVVHGASHIKYNAEGKAVYHRDYFDMGQMIYDHVPFVRGMVKFVDKRMKAKHDPTFNRE